MTAHVWLAPLSNLTVFFMWNNTFLNQNYFSSNEHWKIISISQTFQRWDEIEIFFQIEKNKFDVAYVLYMYI